MGAVLPYILGSPGETASFGAFKPSVAHGVWLTIDVPQDAPPGKYVGSLQIAPAKGPVTPQQTMNIPVELTVLPFKLDRIDDITISVTGSTAGAFTSFHPELKDRWWEIAEIVMNDQAQHGMNAITGGPGAVLKGVKDGKADIDYTDMDRWMAMAVKHGLTMPGDSYQGLERLRDCRPTTPRIASPTVSGSPGSVSASAMGNCSKSSMATLKSMQKTRTGPSGCTRSSMNPGPKAATSGHAER